MPAAPSGKEGIEADGRIRKKNGSAAERLQARAQGRQDADRPVVEPVVQLHGGGDRRRGLRLDPARLRAFAERPRISAGAAPGGGGGSPGAGRAGAAGAAAAPPRSPPAGLRGVAGTTRATRFGRIKDYARRAHEEICVLVQVETKPALDQLEEICAVEGVDGGFIGPGGLQAPRGHPAEPPNPRTR